MTPFLHYVLDNLLNMFQIICAGICSLYIWIVEAPLIDYYFLDLSAAKRIKRAVSISTFVSLIKTSPKSLINFVKTLKNGKVINFVQTNMKRDTCNVSCNLLVRTYKREFE